MDYNLINKYLDSEVYWVITSARDYGSPAGAVKYKARINPEYPDSISYLSNDGSVYYTSKILAFVSNLSPILSYHEYHHLQGKRLVFSLINFGLIEEIHKLLVDLEI